jgi:predicted amidohydrolase
MTAPVPGAPIDVAIAQLNAQDALDQNLAAIASLAARVSGVRLFALPEGCLFMGDVEKKRASAEPMPKVGEAPTAGKGMIALSRLAREHRMFVAAGGVAIATGDEKRPHNAHVVFGDGGEVVAVYRKVHLFDVDLADGTSHRESDSTIAGDPREDLVTVDIDGWRLGLSICYDVRFPEHYRRLVDRGVHAILIPAAFTVPTGKDHWHVLLRARAIESQSYVLAPAQWGRHPGNRLTYGKSLIADPWGDVVAQVSDGVGVARTTFEPKRVADVRTQLPSLRHRRS